MNKSSISFFVYAYILYCYATLEIMKIAILAVLFFAALIILNAWM